ncbi:MAG: hypothetical protein KBG80_08250 [Breznakibacter sp.]|nr:hypothetical protein [Breznakibacter sp.]
MVYESLKIEITSLAGSFGIGAAGGATVVVAAITIGLLAAILPVGSFATTEKL